VRIPWRRAVRLDRRPVRTSLLADEAPLSPPLRPLPEPPPQPVYRSTVLLPDPAILTRSLTSLRAGHQKAVTDFYANLFRIDPNLRMMFPPMMGEQNERLFGALLRIASGLDRPNELARYLYQLGADHLKYGVRPEHYAPVGEALLRALRAHSGAWGQEADAGWISAYNFAAGAMIAGAEAHRGPAQWRGRVLRHERRSRNLAVMEIETDEPLPYLAGQYVTVQTAKWPRVWRPFSVANAPAQDGNRITLHVRSIPGGWVSTALVRDTGEGDEVIIGPANGEMNSSQVSDRDLLCVAGGTGLAPLKALVEHVLNADEHAVRAGVGTRRNIHLFHGAKTPLELYDMPDLRDLANTYPWLRVIPVVSDDPAFGGMQGYVSDAALGYADWSEAAAFIAGPSKMVDRTASGLCRGGMGMDQVYRDDLEVSGAV
jgi:NAD(P)H-flavin reductase/hemoglobin-like flavoprotein